MKFSMESPGDAVDRMSAEGYVEQLRAEPGGLRVVRSGQLLAPEGLVVDEVVRFEGEADPGEESIVLALRSSDGRVWGTFCAAYGPGAAGPETAVLQRLPFARAAAVE